MIDDHHLLEVIRLYVDEHPEELHVLSKLRTAIREGKNVLSRKCFEGHITCGAIVLNEHNLVLTVHHRALDRWLLPGGHIEETDSSLELAAKREVQEETGIPLSDLQTIKTHDMTIPIDIDCHEIPENRKKGEPSHYHWDFRFGFRVRSPKVIKQIEEVKAVSWAPSYTLDSKVAARISQIAEG
jgi:8-oxo-dGTP pyrophosphatase MutT (NUDIX family)